MSVAATVGPYQIVRLINEGGQGSVYLGYDSRLERQVAIKIHRLPSSRSQRKAASREARRVAAIQDARVVQIYDVVESSDYLALIMEYVPGCDLEQVLANRALSLASIHTIATDITVALAAARQCDIVHGDVKAANVLVTCEGRVKLTDFGVARLAQAAGNGSGGGSLSAVAPEQLQGDSVDVRTDLFALGRLLYRLLTGESPFPLLCEPEREQNPFLKPAPPLRQRLPEHQDVPEVLCQLVEQLLQLDPEARPTNTHQVRRILRQVGRELPLSTGASLYSEASASFRTEAIADIPVSIPGQLSQYGRSRNAQIAFRRRWFAHLPRSSLGLAATAALVFLAAVATVKLLEAEPVSVYVAQPVMDLTSGSQLAEQVDGPFLVSVVGQTLEQRLGDVRFSGAVSPRSFHAGEPAVNADNAVENIGIHLRCSEAFCLMALNRSNARGESAQQRILFNDAPAVEWREAIRQALFDLFP